MIKLREFERLSYDEIDGADLEALERACVRVGRRVLTFSRKWLAAQQYAGFLQEGPVQLQVLPKIIDDEEEDLGLFIALLTLAKRVPAIEVGAGDLKQVSGSFIELWIRKFGEELSRQLRRNPRRRYRREQIRPRFLRGKLLAQKLADGRHTTTMRYPCEVHPFGLDHPLYQLLRYCNRVLLRQAETIETRRVLEENDLMLSHVSERAFTIQQAERIQLDRLSASYSHLLEQCLLLLRSSTVDLRSGRISQMSMMFDMNRVFQESVYQALLRTRGDLSLDGDRVVEVGREVFLGRLFQEFEMRVDIVLETASGRKVLIDTKYKVPDSNARHGGLSQSDFYQMFGYGRAGRRPYDEIVLLYPSQQVAERDFRGQEIELKVRGVDPGLAWDSGARQFSTSEWATEIAAKLSPRPG